MTINKTRCEWVNADPLEISYHDLEWGVPVHDDTTFFEFLTLEGAQAGLSWMTILKKRDNYKNTFDLYNVKKISTYDTTKITSLLADSGIIRNKLKINSTIQNAKSFLNVQKEFGSFDNYIWKFVSNKPIRSSFKTLAEYPAKTDISIKMSKDLLKRGFKFVGPTICYAFMQATGLADDHQAQCFRHSEI